MSKKQSDKPKSLDEIFLNTIKTTSKEAVKEAISELKKQGLIKENKKSPFQKTETLLYNYMNFYQAVEDKKKQIETIQTEGVPKKSHSITSFNTSDGMRDNKSDMEKAVDKIEEIKSSMIITMSCLQMIDDLLRKLESDPYFEIIPLYYFDGLSREEISERFDVDVKTVTRNKNRLIDTMKIRLFSDEVIEQIFS